MTILTEQLFMAVADGSTILHVGQVQRDGEPYWNAAEQFCQNGGGFNH